MSKWQFAWPVRVYYEDTDAGGVVYHGNYLNFMERARTEWLRQLGFEQDALRQEIGVVFAVRRVTVDYLAPALFNDALTVTVALSHLARVSVKLEQQVLRADTLLCKALVQVVCVACDGFRPCVIPDSLSRSLATCIPNTTFST